MKTLIPLITVIVACATHAQPPAPQPVPPPPPPLPDEEFNIHVVKPTEWVPIGVKAGDFLIVAQAPAPAAAPAPKAGKPAPPAAPAIAAAYGEAAHAHAEAARAHAKLAWSSPFKLSSSSSGSRRTIVIPKGDPSPELLADAEEDLNVMTLILEKALEQGSSDEEGRKALGIDVGSSGIRNVLIEGHGAIFTLKTKIALVPPPAPKKETAKNKETTTSEWDDARRELYGPSDIEKEIHKAFGKMQMNFSYGEDYDEKKVQRLKESLTDALKSASNVRHLSGDQTVTVVVLSSISGPVADIRKIMSRESSSRGGGRGGSSAGSDAPKEIYVKTEREMSDGRSGSRLMLQAKKTDIDSYAKGKLTSDAFRDKVKIQIY